MSSKHTLFRIFYRLGFTPWDGHPTRPEACGPSVEGNDDTLPLPAGSALDSAAVPATARSTWRNTAGRSPASTSCRKALEKARAKAVRRRRRSTSSTPTSRSLSSAGIGANFELIVDNGCLHNMSDGDRDAYVREVSAVAAPDARLLIVAFAPGGRFGVRGVEPAEMERRFTPRLDAAVCRRRAGD